MTAYTICIDPGVNNFGVVMYEKEIVECFQKPIFAEVYLVPPKVHEKSEFHRIDWLLKRLDRDIFMKYPVGRVFCEYPETFGGLVGTAASARGDTLHLATFCGAVMGLSRSQGLPVTFLPVTSWKGNMPKEMVNHRIEKAFRRAGEDPVSVLSSNRSHDWDACGIGCFLMGELK